MSKWYLLSGAENDVAIGTKVAIARNVKGYNFTVKLTPDEKYEIADKIDAVLDEKLPGKFVSTPMNEVGRDLQISLAERGIVSPEFISFAEGRTLIMTEDESLSIMVCEEDHLKIQALLPGLELEKAYELSNTLDSVLDEELEFAFDKKLGYLTQCPWTHTRTAQSCCVLGKQERGQEGAPHNFLPTPQEVGSSPALQRQSKLQGLGMLGLGRGWARHWYLWYFPSLALHQASKKLYVEFLVSGA